MIQEKTAKKAPCGPNEEINEPLILDDFPMDAIQFYNCYGQHMVNREEEPGCCGCGGHAAENLGRQGDRQEYLAPVPISRIKLQWVPIAILLCRILLSAEPHRCRALRRQQCGYL